MLKKVFYDLHSAFIEFIYISKCKNILKTVAKTCVEHDFNNTNLVTKVKEENFHSQLKSHIKQLVTSIQVDIRIYLPLKVIFSLAFGLVKIIFWGRKILMRTSSKSIII